MVAKNKLQSFLKMSTNASGHVSINLQNIHADTKSFYEKHGFKCMQSDDNNLCMAMEGMRIEFVKVPRVSPVDNISITLSVDKLNSSVVQFIYCN